MTTGIAGKRGCLTMELHEHLATVDEMYRTNKRALESTTLSKARVAARTSVIRIPVVVHVLYRTDEENISAAQIQSQIDVLNRDFRMRNTDIGKVPAPFRPLAADAMIEFGLAVRDPQGTTSIFGCARSAVACSGMRSFRVAQTRPTVSSSAIRTSVRKAS
jgi:hypothetical protein